MKVSNRTWVILLFLVIAAAAVGLYFLYNSQVEKRDNALAAKQQAQIMIPALQAQKAGLEDDLADLKEEYASLVQQVEELNITLQEAEGELAVSQARLQLMVESIEYGEKLFALAGRADVEITSIAVEGPAVETITGISYEVTIINLGVKGQNEAIFDFISLVNQDGMFDTTMAGPVNFNIPPLIEPEPYDIESIRETFYQQLLAENLAAVEPETLVDIIQEVIRDMFGLTIEDNDMDERIEFIAGLISDEFSENLREGLAQSMAEDLATAIEQLIADQLAGKVATYWGAAISEVLIPVVEEILEGEEGTTSGDEWSDMFTWIGDEVAGSIQGSLISIISGYISNEIQSDIDELVEPDAARVEALTQAEVAELERLAELIPIPDSTVNISLEIYNYPGE
ncbi:MAG: hypothetical protein JW954_07255 [Dehalococcoidaceae bacterium]|nr:hypothetical protein [Dehalococcoidaceae bacterium]